LDYESRLRELRIIDNTEGKNLPTDEIGIRAAIIVIKEVIADKDAQITVLKDALRKAMFQKSSQKIKEICTNYDPGAGSDYDVYFTDEMKHWASLCDVDITTKDPVSFSI